MEKFRENQLIPEKKHFSMELTASQKKEGVNFGLIKLHNISDSLNRYSSDILEEYGLNIIQEKCLDLISIIKKNPEHYENIDLQDKIGNFEPCAAMLDHIIKYPQKEIMKESLKKEIFNLSLHLEELLSSEKETLH